MKKIIIALLSAIIVALGGYQVGNLGGSGVGEYFATSTTAMTAGNHVTIVSNQGAKLGTIVVASSTSGTLRVRNATSTTDSASTTVALFGASPTSGTYDFNIYLDRGLIVELSSGFVGAYTINFR